MTLVLRRKQAGLGLALSRAISPPLDAIRIRCSDPYQPIFRYFRDEINLFAFPRGRDFENS